MTTVSIIYFTGSGHTGKLAEAVGRGAASVTGATVRLISIDGEDIVKGRYRNDALVASLETSDAIIFGSPTYMGGARRAVQGVRRRDGRPVVRADLARQMGGGLHRFGRAERGQIQHAAIFPHAGHGAGDALGWVG